MPRPEMLKFTPALRLLRAENKWEKIKSFPTMNLKWANVTQLFWPVLASGMGKHCDVVHVTDPAKCGVLGEEVPRLRLSHGQTNMAFDLISAPNHQGHIVGPG
jgi:hypothetical protein